jgi:hypothetical protein
MKIVMQTSMAGGHSLAYGEIVDLPDAIATAWIEAGIAAPVTEPAPAEIQEATAPAAPERATTRRRKAAK